MAGLAEEDTGVRPESAEDMVAKLASEKNVFLTGGPAMGKGNRIVEVSREPEVYMVQVPFANISTSETNAYVIKSEGETLVVDTGAPSDEGEAVLRAALEELQVDLDHTSFFLTHLHLDHAGLIDRMVSRGATIYLSEVDFDYMTLSSSSDFWPLVEAQITAEDFKNETIRKFSRFGMGVRSFNPKGRNLHFVSEGDEIRVGKETFFVVDTSGHTPGHISLFHEASGLFFVGDHVLFDISPGLGLRPGVTDTMGVYFKNLRKMLNMPITRMLVSHGGLKDGWRERIEWLLSHHERRMGRALAYAAEHPGASGQDVIRNMKWNVPLEWEDISPVQKWSIVESGIVALDHLVAEGELVRTQDGTGRYHYREA